MRVVVAFALLATPVARPIFEEVGVCDIAPERVGCWNPQGVPDPDLAAEVRLRLQEYPRDLSFVVGRKNRFLIARHTPYASIRLASEGAAFGLYDLVRRGAPPLVALRVDRAPDVMSATLETTVGVAEETYADLPLRRGASVALKGVRVEVAAVTRLEPLPFQGWPFPDRLRITLGRSEPPAGDGGLTYEAIGQDGKPIQFVDPEGRPLDPEKALAIMNEDAAAKPKPPFPPRAFYAIVTPFQRGSAIVELTTPIALRKVKAIRLRRIVEHMETIGPCALDPRP